MSPSPDPSPVVLPEAVRAVLVAHARAHAPREVVLALGGERRDGALVVTDFEPLPNAAAGDDRFSIAPHVFARAEAALRARGRTWLGFVHSHPRGSATPSLTDRAELWRGCLQLIVAGDDVRAFRLTSDGTSTPVPLAAEAATP